MCERCGRKAIAKGRCHACYEYRRLTGRERGENLIVSHNRRVYLEGKRK